MNSYQQYWYFKRNINYAVRVLYVEQRLSISKETFKMIRLVKEPNNQRIKRQK